MIYSILASILLVTALVLFFDLTPERVTDDILSIITPKDSMRERAKNLRGNRKKHRIYRALMKFRTALTATGKSNEEGFERSSVTKSLQNTSSNGLLVSVDGCAQEINDDNLTSILDGFLVNHYTEWEIPKVIELDIHDSKQVVITGDESQNVSSLIDWDSSNTDVATISQDGVITALNYGETIITAQYGNKICSSIITVTQNATSVEFNDVKMTIGERVLINPIFLPANATETDVIYSFDDGNIISIDEFGAIRALSSGVITVTGVAPNGVTDTFTVSVRDPAFELEKGDVNGDEEINIIDLVRMKKFVCNIIVMQNKNTIASDLNLDEIVNSADLILLRNLLLRT